MEMSPDSDTDEQSVTVRKRMEFWENKTVPYLKVHSPSRDRQGPDPEDEKPHAKLRQKLQERMSVSPNMKTKAEIQEQVKEQKLAPQSLRADEESLVFRKRLEFWESKPVALKSYTPRIQRNRPDKEMEICSFRVNDVHMEIKPSKMEQIRSLPKKETRDSSSEIHLLKPLLKQASESAGEIYTLTSTDKKIPPKREENEDTLALLILNNRDRTQQAEDHLKCSLTETRVPEETVYTGDLNSKFQTHLVRNQKAGRVQNSSEAELQRPSSSLVTQQERMTQSWTSTGPPVSQRAEKNKEMLVKLDFTNRSKQQGLEKPPEMKMPVSQIKEVYRSQEEAQRKETLEINMEEHMKQLIRLSEEEIKTLLNQKIESVQKHFTTELQNELQQLELLLKNKLRGMQTMTEISILERKLEHLANQGKEMEECLKAEIRSSQEEMKTLLAQQFISIQEHLEKRLQGPLSELETEVKAAVNSLTSLRKNVICGFEKHLGVLADVQQMNRDQLNQLEDHLAKIFSGLEINQRLDPQWGKLHS
ncbi:CAP-Gly domain-containing linker protein 1-like isoform X2 [Struthio camelus]|uniref:CAP-Gly domain-containing linker protein 1-like isoform X2 n=1 Tax=Struthio camelus TaxID=8801 RepID=UPI003603D921